MTKEISAADLRALMQSSHEYAVVDIRERREYEKGQIAGASCMPRRLIEFVAHERLPNLSTPIVVYDDDSGRAPLAAATLGQMGYTDLAILVGGIKGWPAAGGTTVRGTNVPSKAFGERIAHAASIPQMSPVELKARMDQGEELIVLDVRTPEEFRSGCIPGANNLPGVELAARIKDLAAGKATVVINCAGRTRSLVGTQTARLLGLSNVYALENGTMGWMLAGLELERGASRDAAQSPANGNTLTETARALARDAGARFISVEDLQALRSPGQPGTVYVIDVRSVEEFRTTHIPGALSVPGGQAIQRADDFVLVQNATVVFYCDGSPRSAMTAYWFRQMGYRSVAVLDEGIPAWTVAGLPLAHGNERAAPFGIEAARSKVEYIEPTTLSELLATGAAIQVIDVDTSAQFAKGHVPGARWMPRGWLELRIQGLVPDQEAPVVASCSDGTNSIFAAVTLAAAGYQNVRTLNGGTAAWRRAGLTLEEGLTGVEGKPDDVVIPAFDRGPEAMKRYLGWEVALQQPSSEAASGEGGGRGS